MMKLMPIHMLSIAIFLCMFLPQSVMASQTEIEFKSGEITLKGTLMLPKGKGLFPAIVFLHGSGVELRKNSKQRAKTFVKNGYAALIFDKRGSGKSGGKPEETQYFSLEDLANDAIAAVTFLAQRDDINSNEIGIHAASQSGWVAPLAAARSTSVKFMIILSASVCSIEEDRVFERGERLKKLGISGSSLEEVKEMQLTEPLVSADKEDAFPRLWEQYKNKSWFKNVYTADNPKVYTDYRKWYGKTAKFNSIPHLEKINIPILWVFGDAKLDILGPVEKSLANLSSLKHQGKDYKILTYKNVGHNLKGAGYEDAMFEWLKGIGN